MRLWKLGLAGVAAAAIAAFAASLHGSKSAGQTGGDQAPAARTASVEPPRAEAPEPAKTGVSKVADGVAAEADSKAESAERGPEPGSEPYAIFPDGTRYYRVKGARRDANGNWVPHVFHVAAQPMDLEGVEPAVPAPSKAPGGSPR